MTNNRVTRFGIPMVVAALTIMGCGGDDGDESSATTTTLEASGVRTTSTTREASFPGPPDGVFEATITVDDWTAAGNSADTFAEVNEEGHYILTLEPGSIHVDCAFADGRTETCFDGNYTSIGPDEIVVGDDAGTGSTRWSFANNELRFTIDDPSKTVERAIFTSKPWIKIG